MAKKTAQQKPGPKPGQGRVRSAVLNVRGTPQWKAWLGRFAAHCRKDYSDVIDEALLRYARSEGFDMPPKR